MAELPQSPTAASSSGSNDTQLFAHFALTNQPFTVANGAKLEEIAAAAKEKTRTALHEMGLRPRELKASVAGPSSLITTNATAKQYAAFNAAVVLEDVKDSPGVKSQITSWRNSAEEHLTSPSAQEVDRLRRQLADAKANLAAASKKKKPEAESLVSRLETQLSLAELTGMVLALQQQKKEQDDKLKEQDDKLKEQDGKIQELEQQKEEQDDKIQLLNLSVTQLGQRSIAKNILNHLKKSVPIAPKDANGNPKSLQTVAYELASLQPQKLGGLLPEDIHLLSEWIVGTRMVAHPLFSPTLIATTATTARSMGAPAESVERIRSYANSLL